MGQLIPRILHQIWLGGSPIPEEFLEFSAGWRRAHPQWDYRLWTDRRLPRLASNATTNASHMVASGDVDKPTKGTYFRRSRI